MDESTRLGYSPKRIRKMLETSHPVEVAKRLVVSGDFQEGFKSMISMGRPNLTVESIMLDDQFASLFTPEERVAAKWRLDTAMRA